MEDNLPDPPPGYRPPMRRATIMWAIKQVVAGVGLTLLAFWVHLPWAALIGVGVILLGIAFYFVEKKSQTGYW